MRSIILMAALAAAACGPSSRAEGVPEYTYEVVHVYPHDRTVFTEGLFYLNGYLYESAGLKGESSVRKVRFETGEIVQKHELPEEYFGEGIVNWKDRMVQLTYTTEVGFVYDLATMSVRQEFHYPGEGWALTQDGKRIYMSDGTPEIRILDPETLREAGRRITVKDNGEPVKEVNELEWVKGEIFANVWHTDRIARIDPKTGNVVGWINLSGLLTPEERNEGPDPEENVLNGIAYDAAHDRLFVTGKRWPKLFEVRIKKK